MKLRILSIARQEALEAAQFYEAQRRELGFVFLDAHESALQAIAQNPRQFLVWPAWTDRRWEVRRALLHRFPYALIYVIRGEEILVLATAHMKRRPSSLVGQIKRRL